MRTILAALVLATAVLSPVPAPAADPEVNAIPAPADWRTESFKFPLLFAPSIPYEGTEHVRFAPTWTKFAEENGFSYVFMWDLKTRPVAPEDLEDYLETYFDGLMRNVGRQRNLADKEIKTSAAVHPMAALADWAQGYGVEVRTWNAFSKGEPLLLNGEVGQRDCGERMQIFFAFSQARRDRPIWDGLRAARKATTCPAARS